MKRGAGQPLLMALTGRLREVVEPVPRRLRERRFWLVQLLVAAVTLFHVAGELTGFADAYGSLRHFPVTLYVVPVAYAALSYGVEGGLLTGVWALLLATPNVLVWHREEPAGDLALLGVVLTMGIVLAWRAEREATLRQQAEDARERVARSRERLQYLLQRITSAQESERERIARELHDDTIQSLVLVGRVLDSVAEDLSDDGARARVEAARAQVDAAIDGVRRLVRGLRPPMLAHLGLVPSIEWLLLDVRQRQPIRTELVVETPIPRLGGERELLIFRIVQEAVRNAELHASPSRIAVRLAIGADAVEGSVEDDGRGFDAQEVLANPSAGLGLHGMFERAQLAGGTVRVDASPGQGTTVTFRIPVEPTR